MTVVQRQIWWLGTFALLLSTTVATLFLLPYRASSLHVILPLLLTYGWVRFMVVIWKPLYREQVSPGCCVVMLFAAFGIFFMLGIVYRVAVGHVE
jgi:hypothetical protein